MTGEPIVGQAPGEAPPAVPMKMVKIKLVGTLKGRDGDGNPRVVVEELEMNMPQSLDDYRQASMMVHSHLIQSGGLRLRLTNETYEFYPLSEFEKVSTEFQHVVGVAL